MLRTCSILHTKLFQASSSASIAGAPIESNGKFMVCRDVHNQTVCGKIIPLNVQPHLFLLSYRYHIQLIPVWTPPIPTPTLSPLRVLPIFTLNHVKYYALLGLIYSGSAGASGRWPAPAGDLSHSSNLSPMLVARNN